MHELWPFVGGIEIALTVVAAAAWVAFHVWHILAENKEIAEGIEAASEVGADPAAPDPATTLTTPAP